MFKSEILFIQFNSEIIAYWQLNKKKGKGTNFGKR